MGMIESQSDAYCKKVLRIKSIASYILHDCIEEFHALSKEEVKEILDEDNPSNQIRLLNSEDLSKPDAKIFYDLLSKVSKKQDEMFVDLEPQGKLEPGYPLLRVRGGILGNLFPSSSLCEIETGTSLA